MARILVVDDQELMRDSLAANLAREGHDVIATHDGTILVTNPEGGGARFEIRV